MDCRRYRESHPEEGEEAQRHLQICADCRSFRRAWELLGEYPSLDPGPDFVRKVRARLAPSVRKWVLPLALAAGLLLVAGLAYLGFSSAGSPEGLGALPPEEQRELAENLELLQNLDLLRALEFVGEFAHPLGENPG